MLQRVMQPRTDGRDKNAQKWAWMMQRQQDISKNKQ